MSETSLPLAGIRVLELSSFVSASYSGTLLGDFGAEVIKVERPGPGDLQRGLGTFVEGDDERSLWWMALARNKRSVCLDLRDERIHPLFRRLVEWADVITENFRPGTLERWGLGWDWIHEVNPSAHLLRVSGYGQTGPDRALPSFERVAQAFSGLMFVTGEPDGPPQRSGLPVCDYTSGLWGAVGILLAIVHQLRSTDGEGQVIDQAIYASVIPMLKDIAGAYDRFGDVAQRVGNRSSSAAPGDALRTRDGEWVFVAPTGDAVFKRTMVAIGRLDLADDPLFASNRGRLQNRAALDDALSAWVGARDLSEVLGVLREHQVPATPVQSIADLFESEQSQVREDFIEADDPVVGQFRMPGVFPRLSSTPGTVRSMAPRIGEHTDEVFGELGIPAADVARLRRIGVVQ